MAEDEPRRAGRRLEWPTIWHKDQLPFPWGAPKRLRKSVARVTQKQREAAEAAVRAHFEGGEMSAPQAIEDAQ